MGLMRTCCISLGEEFVFFVSGLLVRFLSVACSIWDE